MMMCVCVWGGGGGGGGGGGVAGVFERVEGLCALEPHVQLKSFPPPDGNQT